MNQEEKLILHHYLNMLLAYKSLENEYIALLLKKLNEDFIIDDEIHAKNIFFHFMSLMYPKCTLGVVIKFHQEYYKICRDYLIKQPLCAGSSSWIIGINNNLCHTRCYKKYQRKIKIKDGQGIGIHLRCFKIIHNFEYTLNKFN